MTKSTLLILALIFLMAFITAPGFADDGMQRFNLQGDTYYFPTIAKTTVGAGYTVATVAKGLLELRVAATAPMDNMPMLVGAGAGISIPTLIEQLGGTWAMPAIKASVGAGAFYDFSSNTDADPKRKRILPAVYVTILKVTF